MIDLLKKIIFYFWNPKIFLIRDSSGKVVDDIKRKNHSKKIQKQLDSGELLRPGHHGTNVKYKKGEGPKCYKVETKSKISIKGHGIK